jgi:GT2 family glycosyltransferase
MKHLPPVGPNSGAALGPFSGAVNTAERFLAITEQEIALRRHWGVAFTHYDALVAFGMTMVRDVGPWDTNLPQYFADNDYYRRVRLAGYSVIETGLTVAHPNASSTIESDPRRKFLNGVTFPLYQRYYARKWGGEPGYETYDRPFNGAI